MGILGRWLQHTDRELPHRDHRQQATVQGRVVLATVRDPCIVVYEWEHFSSPDGKRKKTDDKYSIQPKGSNSTYLAGLLRFEEHGGLQVPVFSVLTMTPSESVSKLHDRMPLILGKETVESWIRPDGNLREMSKMALTEMVVEKAV